MACRWLVSFFASALLVGCMSVDDEPRPEHNIAPEAALRAPVVAPMGAVVSLDAGASADRDGDSVAYLFDFGDGSDPVRSSDPVVQHVYAAQGLYTVRVRVVDPAGGEGLAVQDVAVRADLADVPSCERASDCVLGDECLGGLCYSTGGAID